MNYLKKVIINLNSWLYNQLLASESPISKSERFIASVTFAIFATAFCGYQIVTARFHHLDSAFLMETLTAIQQTGIPTTYLGPSYLDAHPTFSTDSDIVCKSDLTPSGRGLSVLNSHAYLILYPLATFTWLFPPDVIISIANGIGFTSIIFILFWIIRKQGVPILGAIAFCSLVMAHPAWSQASLGDYYADRFFMPLGLFYIALFYDKIILQNKLSSRYLPLILVVGLLAASATERGAIMIASFTIAALILYRKNITYLKTRILLTLFSLMLLAYTFLYIKFLYTYIPGTGNIGASLQNILHILKLLESEAYVAKLREFIVINILMFGIFALADWRLALIGFASMLPNILVTIGGAELTGWSTHYHSMYFPFLAFASSIGFSKLWIFLRKTIYQLILIALLLVLLPAISNYSTGYATQNGAVKRLFLYYTKGSLAYERTLYDLFQKVSEAVPSGAKVTSSEGFGPTLYLDRTFYYYPIGIDVADYAVLLRASQPDGSFYYAGAVSYLGESVKLDICLTERLKKAGYNLDNPRLLIGNYAVLERIKK